MQRLAKIFGGETDVLRGEGTPQTMQAAGERRLCVGHRQMFGVAQAHDSGACHDGPQCEAAPQRAGERRVMAKDAVYPFLFMTALFEGWRA